MLVILGTYFDSPGIDIKMQLSLRGLYGYISVVNITLDNSGFNASSSFLVEIVAALSCHSSCQGQVFSCTPFAMGKQCEFEEFCSLHDFVMACQKVFNNVLVAVHISSCFTLKLDCSHVVSFLSWYTRPRYFQLLTWTSKGKSVHITGKIALKLIQLASLKVACRKITKI